MKLWQAGMLGLIMSVLAVGHVGAAETGGSTTAPAKPSKSWAARRHHSSTNAQASTTGSHKPHVSKKTPKKPTEAAKTPTPAPTSATGQ